MERFCAKKLKVESKMNTDWGEEKKYRRGSKPDVYGNAQRHGLRNIQTGFQRFEGS